MADPIVNPDAGGGTGRAGAEGGGATPPAWTAQLKDDLKSNEFFTQFGSVTDLGKHALETDGKLKDALFIPGEGAKEEDWNPIYTRLGKPADPDGYAIAKPEGWPEEVLYDPAGEAWFKQMAFKHHLSAKTAKDLYDSYQGTYLEAIKKDVAAKEEAKNTAIANLKKEWGEDGWKSNLVLAQRAIETLGDADFKKYLDDTGLGNHPSMINMFVKIGKAMGEDSFVKGDGGGHQDKSGGEQLSYPSMEKK